MVGHAALAFAVGAWILNRAGATRERALLVGLAAGAFAVVPDVDMGYAIVGVVSADTLALGTLQSAFWDAGLTVHRGVTHSVVVGAVGAIAFGLLAYRGLFRLAGLGTLLGVVAGTVALVGGLEAGVMASFVLAGGGVVLGTRYLRLDPQDVLVASLVGILTHPFGDIFTGSPPELLYPFDIRLLPARVTLSSDPTLHLLATFGLELASIWLAIGVFLLLRGEPFLGHLRPRAVIGAGYGAAVFAVPPPTLAVSYQFVFSVLAVGVVGSMAHLPIPSVSKNRSKRTILLTGLATVTVAWLCYSGSYVALTA